MSSAFQVSVPLHKGAESFSFFSHLIGVISALVGGAFLIWQADGALERTAQAIYVFTLLCMFSASTLHHAIQTASGHERSGIMRRLDHVAIYLFIAGTYTPVSLIGIGGTWGTSILSVVWGVAVVGIILKLFAPFTPRWVTSGVYVAMGWIAVVAIKPLLQQFPVNALLLMLAGGIVYTVGAVGYALKKPDLWPARIGFHGVWHIMVLIGAACHFVMIYVYV